MATFLVRLGTADGAVATRTMEAADEVSLRAEVARQGARLFSARPAESGRPVAWAALSASALSLGKMVSGRRSVKTDEFLVFNQELVSLLKAGLPVVTGFEILLERQENPYFR